jgi:hypothetical protein
MGLAGVWAVGAELRFNRDIRPILSENCFACHGPDRNTRMAGLRLDVREEAVAKGAIAPGNPQASKLVQRIRSPKPALRMPPLSSHKVLTERQKELLEQWIAQGAPYEPHWAYIPPERPQAPAGPAGVDYLVNKKLEEKKLRPVGEADRRTLIRRLSFDLRGLPPSWDEVRAFVEDPDPQAYEKLVERYLASPAYGERMALWWLDLVRYADTVGFHSDVPVSVYPYRDYVIRAFNSNKPFDVFTREQLAGDLLPGAGREQLIASAYNRLNRMTNEGGAQPKEYLAIYAADRVRTTGNVWLGSTIGCAECHDHKFDPFTTRDFYQLKAFFADIEERGVYNGHGDFGPRIQAPPAGRESELERMESELATLRRQGEGKLAETPEALAQFAGWLRARSAEWLPLSRGKVTSASGLRFRRTEEGAFLAAGRMPSRDLHTVELELRRGRLTALRIEALAPEELTGGDCSFLVTKIEGELVRGNKLVPLEFALGVSDGGDPAHPARYALDGNDHTGWGANGGLRRNVEQAVFVLKTPLETRPGDRLRLRLNYEGWASRQVLGHFRLSVTGADFPELVPPAEDFEHPVRLRTYFRAYTQGNANWQALRALERRRQELLDNGGECLITRAAEPRLTRILPRGNWMDDSGEIVEPRTPHFLKPLAASGRPTRLDLANWLVDRDNPLTARVVVNRLWKMFFGTGISKSLDDLGSQGEPPVNPELLDWLAVEFMDSGWDIKHMVRTMVLSATYRRSSHATPELKEADPYNRYHARQAVTRLEAEFVRDNALAVSGLLHAKVGGPSAKPYQPAGYYRELNFPKREYVPDWNENQYRRGLYTHRQRTFPHPALLAFDATPREECTAERPVSNTPLQALVLLNDPSFVEAARLFAERMLRHGGATAEERIDFAFREAFSRRPTDAERAILRRLYESQRAHYRRNRGAAAELLAVGMARAPRELDRRELAAWTAVARALFNKHEFVMRY